MATSTATVTVTVEGTCTATDDSFSTTSNTAITIPVADLLANDTANGVPATLANVTFTIVSQPANGTLVDNEDGTLTYTPNEGFCGPDPFDYEITNICTELPPEPTCVGGLFMQGNTLRHEDGLPVAEWGGAFASSPEYIEISYGGDNPIGPIPLQMFSDSPYMYIRADGGGALQNEFGSVVIPCSEEGRTEITAAVVGDEPGEPFCILVCIVGMQ